VKHYFSVSREKKGIDVESGRERHGVKANVAFAKVNLSVVKRKIDAVDGAGARH
jgi:hypothetical protein